MSLFLPGSNETFTANTTHRAVHVFFFLCLSLLQHVAAFSMSSRGPLLYYTRFNQIFKKNHSHWATGNRKSRGSSMPGISHLGAIFNSTSSLLSSVPSFQLLTFPPGSSVAFLPFLHLCCWLVGRSLASPHGGEEEVIMTFTQSFIMCNVATK